uniref:Uncharacterized protein n=2 Tax=Anguilla anguilla TaxID=7936 RepID=A0A0E9QZ30_ANGAN
MENRFALQLKALEYNNWFSFNINDSNEINSLIKWLNQMYLSVNLKDFEENEKLTVKILEATKCPFSWNKPIFALGWIITKCVHIKSINLRHKKVSKRFLMKTSRACSENRT